MKEIVNKMKTCPTCPKKKQQTVSYDYTIKDTQSTKITSIRTSPIKKPSKKTTI